jgi:hypothetical protein
MWRMDRYRPRSQNMRLLALGMFLIGLTAGYLRVVRHFRVTELPSERHFGPPGPVKPAGEVYLEPIGIDALNDAMQMRAYLSPSISNSKNARTASDRGDLTLLVTHDDTVEEVKLAAADHLATSTFEGDLNKGSVTHYPLDAYQARFDVQLLEGKSSLRLPVRVTMWEGVLGYKLHTTSQPGPPYDVELTTAITRSGAFVLFALCAYGAMIMLACCALAIGILTFIDVRRPEATLVGALAAIVFALPVVRNALPGSPPLGVGADLWVFLWTELAAVLALALQVFKWAKSGPRP